MTDKEAMKLALVIEEFDNNNESLPLELLKPIAETLRALADPMREVQRLGQEIEQEPVCPDCKAKVLYECVACSSNNYPPPQRTEQEPVGEVSGHDWSTGLLYRDLEPGTPLYTTPPQRTWVGLTDEEYVHITDSVFHQGHGLVAYYSAIEAKLKEKNT